MNNSKVANRTDLIVASILIPVFLIGVVLHLLLLFDIRVLKFQGGVQYTKADLLINLVLWLLFIIPGILWTLYLLFLKK